MNDHDSTAPSATPKPLIFQGRPITYILLDGVPHFCLADLCAAMRWSDNAAKIIDRPDFPSYAKRVVEEQTAKGWQPVDVLSPVGVFHWGHAVDPGRSQGLVAWAKREAARICPCPRPGDPAIFLTPMDDGTLPPRPFKFSGRRSEWFDLRDSGVPSAEQKALQDHNQQERIIMDRLVDRLQAERSTAAGAAAR